MRWIWLLALATTCVAYAQPDGEAGSPTFAQAVDAAWRRSPAGSAVEARRAEQRALQDSASSWMPEPPSLTLSQRTDRYNDDHGARELEAELEVPLWMPGTRSAAIGLAQAEATALEARLQLAQLNIAAQVREAAWDARIAQSALETATRRVDAAEALAADVRRRVEAGDLARVDFNRAQAAVQEAQAERAAARAQLVRAKRAYTALTGMTAWPAGAEAATEAPMLEEHPRLITAFRAIEAAQARLRKVSETTRDAPQLLLGVVREREAFEDNYYNSTRIGVRVPFGTDARNAPRVAAANAALIEAQTAARLTQAELEAEVDAARAALVEAERVAELSAERERLAADTQQLLDKSFRLGEIDLPTRLRAESELYEAERALHQARYEEARARSRLLQAYGVLP